MFFPSTGSFAAFTGGLAVPKTCLAQPPSFCCRVSSGKAQKICLMVLRTKTRASVRAACAPAWGNPAINASYSCSMSPGYHSSLWPSSCHCTLEHSAALIFWWPLHPIDVFTIIPTILKQETVPVSHPYHHLHCIDRKVRFRERKVVAFDHTVWYWKNRPQYMPANPQGEVFLFTMLLTRWQVTSCLVSAAQVWNGGVSLIDTTILAFFYLLTHL